MILNFTVYTVLEKYFHKKKDVHVLVTKLCFSSTKQCKKTTDAKIRCKIKKKKKNMVKKKKTKF
jgi:hypothetical protein